MNKFGLLDEDDDVVETDASESFSDKLAAFPPAAAKHRVDIAAMDAAAAPHGFVSREASPSAVQFQAPTRRRRTPVEPTRHLAIRLTSSQYDRFVAYADRHKLTYHDALSRLLENSSD